MLFVLVPLLSLLAIQPILTGILPWRGDGLLHLVRLAELERAIWAGVVFPRWSPDLGYGFGFPLFHYYAPFSYYVGLIPRLLGLSLPVSMAISYVLALWVLGWGVALWARDVWRNWVGVTTAVLAALYAPYILYNVYHRAALAELWGLAWLVLVLWAVNRMITDQRLKNEDSPRFPIFNVQSLIFIAVFYALLILSHNITAMIGTPLILGYTILLTFSRRPFNLYPSSFILLGLALGLGLSAFFWLPAFFERHLVQIENLTATSGFTYVNHFLSLAAIFAQPKTVDPMQVNPAIPRSLSWPVVILAVFAWLPVKGLKIEKLKMMKVQRLGLTLAALLCLLMVLPWSKALWETVELLSFVQFPWRFLGPASIFLSMLAAFGAIQLSNRLHSQFKINYSLLIIILTFLILLFSLTWLFPSRAQTLPNDLSPSETIQFEVETGWLGTTAAADYLPREVQQLPKPDVAFSGLSGSELPSELVIQNLETSYTEMSFSYVVDEPATAVFHQFFFPGWQAELDGVPIEISATETEGLITAVLPAGEHTFELSFGNTTLRSVANTVSVISFVVLVILIVYCVLRRNSVHNSQVTIHNSQLLIYSIATVLVIFGFKTLLLDHINSPFRTEYFGQTVAGPTVNFGNAIELIGIDLPTEAVPADGQIDLTLTWRALPPVTEEYSVSVQLLNENGRRVAQSDSFHPAGFPLPRWQDGEYGIDSHRLEPLPATPPGEYELVVFVYNLTNGQRLNTLNQDNLPIGNELSLGIISLTNPQQFPDKSALAISKTETEGGGSAPFLAENVQLLGYDAALEAAEVGQVVPLTLYWHTPQTPGQDYETRIWISCENDVTAVSLPLDNGTTPNTTWLPGQIQRAEFDLPLKPVDEVGNSLQPGFCSLYVGLWSPSESMSISLETFRLNVPERSYELPETAVSFNQSFSDLVTLVGYKLEKQEIASFETLPMTLFWQPDELIESSYKVFVQLLDDNGRIVTQQDQIPASGARPTTGWVPGEFVQDDYALVLPPDVTPGQYQLITGLYNAETGERLPLTDGSGDAITLPVSIEVKTAE